MPPFPRTALCVAASVLCACGTPTAPDLQLVVPSKIAAGSPISLKATATTGDGKIGAGTVKFSSADGTFVDGADVVLDPFGTAVTTFSCKPTYDEGTSFTITAKWTTKEGTAEASGRTKVDATANPSDGGQTSMPPTSALAYLPSCVRTRYEPDEVSVNGQAGPLGTVSFRIKNGISAGVLFREEGGQYFTSGTLTGTPMTVSSTGLWMWPSTQVVQTGVLYQETNTNQGSMSTYMNFRIDTSGDGGVNCPAGGGAGTLAYERVMFWPNNDGGVTAGAYTFSCPDAGLSVYGCFAFR